MMPGSVQTRSSIANIRAALDASLQRLQTDYLDLYQVHWPQRPTNCFGKLGYSWNESAGRHLLETLEALRMSARRQNPLHWRL
jgi:aryl-alcohol dehydrogenase-like predicted oxidoreductase